MKYLQDIVEPKENNFSLARLIAALSVLISHAFLLHSGHPGNEFLAGQTFYDLGQHAVNVFFVLSGILVSASAARSTSFLDFATARVLRIFPALIACALVVALVLGPLVTLLTFGGYVSSKELPYFVFQAITVATGTGTLPGVFVGNPFPSIVILPIWTIKYEIACYLLLALMAFSKRPSSTGGFAFFIAVTWIAGAGLLIAHSSKPANPLDHLARFWLCFSFGITLYRFRSMIPLSTGLIVLLALFWWWCALGTAFERVVSLFATGYGAVWFASLPLGRLRVISNEIDLSYGIYVFGFPITQIVIWAWPTISIVTLELAVIPIAVAIANLSWFAIEKPALKSRRAITAKFNSLRSYIAFKAGRIVRQMHEYGI